MIGSEVVRSGRFGVQRAVTYIGMPTVTTCASASLPLYVKIGVLILGVVAERRLQRA